MDNIAMFFPFIVMGIVGYFIFRWFKKRKVFNNDGLSSDEIIWSKAVWGLYFTIPVILIFEVILDDIRGGNKNIVATIVNFFATRFVVKKMIENKINLRYPKLTTSLISISIFVLQVIIGSFIFPSLV